MPTQALADFLGLSVRMRVVNHVARRLAGFRLLFASGAALVLAASGLLLVHALSVRFGWGRLPSALACSLPVALGGLLAHWIFRLAARAARLGLSRRVDDIFAAEYRRELASGTHDDLRQRWALDRDETARIVRDAPLRLPLLGEFRRRRLDAAAAKVLRAFHAART